MLAVCRATIIFTVVYLLIGALAQDNNATADENESPVIRYFNEHYNIYGVDKYTLRISLRQESYLKFGQESAGYTNWNYSYSYYIRSDDSNCTVTKAIVRLDVRTVRPNWVDRDKSFEQPPVYVCCGCLIDDIPTTCQCENPTALTQQHSGQVCNYLKRDETGEGLRNDYDDFYKGLQNHQDAKVQNWASMAQEMYDRMNNLPSQPSCDVVRSAMEKVAKEAVTKYQQINQKYDMDTKDGLTNGVAF